MVAEEEQSR